MRSFESRVALKTATIGFALSYLFSALSGGSPLVNLWRAGVAFGVMLFLGFVWGRVLGTAFREAAVKLQSQKQEEAS